MVISVSTVPRFCLDATFAEHQQMAAICGTTQSVFMYITQALVLARVNLLAK